MFHDFDMASTMQQMLSLSCCWVCVAARDNFVDDLSFVLFPQFLSSNHNFLSLSVSDTLQYYEGVILLLCMWRLLGVAKFVCWQTLISCSFWVWSLLGRHEQRGWPGSSWVKNCGRAFQKWWSTSKFWTSCSKPLLLSSSCLWSEAYTLNSLVAQSQSSDFAPSNFSAVARPCTRYCVPYSYYTSVVLAGCEIFQWKWRHDHLLVTCLCGCQSETLLLRLSLTLSLYILVCP